MVFGWKTISEKELASERVQKAEISKIHADGKHAKGHLTAFITAVVLAVFSVVLVSGGF